MSSEYSSEGEGEGQGRTGMGPGVWDAVAGKNDQGSQLQDGSKVEKVLEVRTPRWRSNDVRPFTFSLSLSTKT